jgi:hypothetical protein
MPCLGLSSSGFSAVERRWCVPTTTAEASGPAQPQPEPEGLPTGITARFRHVLHKVAFSPVDETVKIKETARDAAVAQW